MAKRAPTKLRRGLDPDKEPQVILKPNAPQIEIINRLLERGLHGNTAARVVDRIFCEGLARYMP